MKKIALSLIAALLAAVLAGCAGTTVVVGNCTCPTGAPTAATEAPAETPAPTEAPAAADGAVRTGLAMITDLTDCTNASAEGDGQVKFDVDFAAVTLDENGVIVSCLIDSLGAAVTFNTTGAITSDVTAEVKTKNELGEAYGMKAAGSAYEWNEQAANFSAYVTGKAAAEVAGIAVDEKTAPTDADLAAGVTIAIGGFQALIAKALG